MRQGFKTCARVALVCLCASPAHAAYRDSTVGTGSSATPACAVPASVAANDIVVLIAAIDSSDAVFDTTDFPTSFTRFGDYNITADGQSVGVGWKRLTGSDTGTYTFGDVGGSGDWVCFAFAFSGRHTTDPPVLTSAIQNTAQASPASVNATGVTAVEGDDMLMLSAPDTQGSGASPGHTTPTNYLEKEDTDNAWTMAGGFTRDNVTAGATGTITATADSGTEPMGWAAYLVRIPLASVGGATPARLTLIGVGP